MASFSKDRADEMHSCIALLEKLKDIVADPNPNKEAAQLGLELCDTVRRRVGRAGDRLYSAKMAIQRREAAEERRIAEEAASAAAAAAAAADAAAVAIGSVTTMEQLMRCVPNEHQRDIFRRLTTRHEQDRLYLVDYVPNVSADRKKAHVQGAFTLLGSVNAKGERSQYTVSFYKDAAKPCPFWCTCPDHKFKSAKQGTMCKHISFIVLRYAKLMDPAIFANRTLTSEQHAKLCEMLSRPLKESADRGLVAFATSAKDYEVPADRVFADDDVCAICYEALSHDVKLCCCPTCTSALHGDCMALWLTRKDSCVMCRSECWKDYKKAMHIGA